MGLQMRKCCSVDYWHATQFDRDSFPLGLVYVKDRLRRRSAWTPCYICYFCYTLGTGLVFSSRQACYICYFCYKSRFCSSCSNCSRGWAIRAQR